MPPAIGRSVPRREGRAKVTGQARYVDDLTLPGMVHGLTVRSTVSRGTIRSVEFGDGIPWDDITIVTARDIPGRNAVLLITDDQPYLADTRINHAEEPVLLLAHADRSCSRKRAAGSRIHVDPLPPVFGIDESLEARDVIWGDANVFKAYRVGRGNVDAAWGEATAIIEGEYETHAQEQLYIEPNGMLALADRVDRCDRMGIPAMPLLRAQGTGGAVRAARRENPGRPDGDWWRLWREGRVPVDHRRARSAPRLEERPSSEADLRPR